jgi:two-component system NtrC family sensor kinase
VPVVSEQWIRPSEGPHDPELVERLGWLLRLRWLVVPLFVAVELASGLLVGRRTAWPPLVAGAAVLALNGAWSALLASRAGPRRLVAFARFEALLVVSLPVLVALLHGDGSQALRYGALVGVVGAAVALPAPGDVALVALWAMAALVGADAVAVGFDAARVSHALVARWAVECGVVATVAIVAGYLQQLRVRSADRVRLLSAHADKSRLEWEAALDNLNEMVVVTDLDGVVSRANRAFAKLLGARPHEVVGRPLRGLLAGHPERWWSQRSGGILELEDPVFDTLFEITVTRVGDRLVRVARDVGEQRRLYARLVQADKLASVGLLASGVAHEINSPTAFVTSNLTEVKRYCQAFERAISELCEVAMASGAAEKASAVMQDREIAFARREAAAALQESLAGMERIRGMVANLRSVARRDQAGEPVAAVSLAEVIDVVSRTAAQELRAADAHVTIRQSAWIMGHRGEIVDVVLNLVVNAVQARDGERPNHVVIDVSRENGTAVLRVSDTGKGIPAGHLKRLYEPFFTTKAPGEGTGLGLSLARDIVLAHGGSIDVQTEVGAGTTFTVRFPAVDPDALDGATRTPIPFAAALSPLRIT